jgi:putative glutamine amidotransferase
MFDGLVLTGGADIHPSFYGEEINAPITLSPDQRTEFDLNIFRAAQNAGKPILAICHGMQIMNVALGGTLVQDLSTQVPGSLVHRGDAAPALHKITMKTGSTIAAIMQGLDEFEVSSSHHQAVKTTGGALEITARAPDGIVEAIEIPGVPAILGIQWHPEKDPESEPTRRIFQWLVERARGDAP